MERLVSSYNYYLSISDKRLENRFGMSSIFSPILTLVIYGIILFVIRKIMENRKPFELKTFMVFYNLFQVIASFYNCFEILYLVIKMKYNLTCEPVDYSDDPDATSLAYAIHFYYVMKVTDLMDTIIFALRKKTNQITFLHVFHHSSMIITGWLGTKWVPGGQSFVCVMFNSFVHGVMYSYYGLASMGPSVQKYLWWKKYLTQLQLFQFLCVVSHSIVNATQTECTYPKAFVYSTAIYTTLIAALFVNFYRKSYIKKSAQIENKKTE
ncbi:elongation of very long chain fatty acids AAEL008004-like protein [Brachionus plicatilis]|uniref:Elongation of very long chain fatty acids protein n=1 Tax=Brachionus plicatilis TaxID=10195 RepID=A0A3M7RR24_BRAPC|nr:elongation of very long chain fatty acid 9b [Brachionus plicatilis]RNA25919.1 elongation of very long chain fatty acids AAEL008004-like protein [Brachionus plicatilis]